MSSEFRSLYPANNTPNTYWTNATSAQNGITFGVNPNSDFLVSYLDWVTWTPVAGTGVTSITSSTGSIYAQVGDNLILILSVDFVKDGTDTVAAFTGLPAPLNEILGATAAVPTFVENLDVPALTGALAEIGNPDQSTLTLTAVGNLTDTETHRVRLQLMYKVSQN